MKESYQPLHLKYRPKKFDELVGQNAIKTTLKQALKTNRIASAYIFCGPRGTGKTSSARILARSLNCLDSEVPTSDPCGQCEVCCNISTGTSLDVIEIDAASNTGVDNIRELIERSRFAPVQSRWKVYVIDECHMLSTAAFNALLKTLEEPPPNVVFILATTDPQRVLQTILSRCQRFDFKRIPLNDLIKHLGLIASKEEISIEQEAIQIIAEKSQGGMRDAESMLDQLSLLDPPITIAQVWDLLGAIPENEILLITSALAKGDPLSLVESCRGLLDYGREPVMILQGLASMIRDLILLYLAPEKQELLNISNTLSDKLVEIKMLVSLDKLLLWQAELKGTEAQIRNSMQPRLWIEVLLLGILAQKPIKEEKIIKNSAPKSPATKISSSLNDGNNEISYQDISKSKKDQIVNKSNSEEHITLKENPEIELQELWLKILNNLELPSTRMLLSQQAKLIKINEENAFIQVAENWTEMVQSRIGLLNQAIYTTLGSNKKIIITRGPDIVSTQVVNQNKLKILEKDQIIKPLNQEGIVPKSKSASEIPAQKIMAKTQDIEKTSSEEATSKVKPIDDNAKRIADFFNGEILDD